jgi:flavin-dependent dehydrogenase
MYDAIVVGARCAGSPTAMLLARRGYNVLLLDRDAFPSDIMSTHYIHVPGQARLQRWGLLDRVIATGAPFITRRTLHFNGMSFQPPNPPLPEGVSSDTICPRRVLLDKILVDGAVEAGAEFRERSPVRDLIWDDGRVVGVLAGPRGREVEERARIVIGADGMRSTVARLVQAAEYDARPSLTFGYYAYWTGIPDTGMHIYFNADGTGILVFPTNWGQTCIGVGGLHAGFQDFRRNIEANYFAVIDRVPDLGPQVRAATREEPFQGTADMPNFFRKPFGPGWALIGDAGYHRDFITGLGINDAFFQAELLAGAIDAGLSGQQPLDQALEMFERTRNDYAKPLYDLTTRLAAGEQLPLTDLMLFGVAIARMIPEARITTPV